jgi:hypothetical protein
LTYKKHWQWQSGVPLLPYLKMANTMAIQFSLLKFCYSKITARLPAA